MTPRASLRLSPPRSAANCSIKEKPVRVAYIGGVFRSRIVLERFRELIQKEIGDSVTPPLLGPAAGALLEAYRAVGLKCTLSNAPQEKT